MDMVQLIDLGRLKKELVSGEVSTDEMVRYYNSLYSNFRQFDDKIAVFDVVSVVLLKLSKIEQEQLVEIHDEWIRHIFVCLDDRNAMPKVLNFINKAIAYVKPYEDVEEMLVRWLDFLVESFNNTKEVMNLMEAMVKHVKKAICEFYDKKTLFILRLFRNFASDSVTNASNKLLITIYNNLYLHDKWFEKWDSLLYEHLLEPKYSKNLQIYFVPAIFKIDKSCFKVFLNKHFASNDTLLLTDLLRVSFQLELDPMNMVDFGFDHLLTNSAIQIRLNALDLVCFSPKSTKPVGTKVFDLIKDNILHIIMDLNSVDSRNMFISIIFAFFIRLKDSSHYEMKKKKHFLPETKHFIEWLLDFFTASITPISTYHQTLVSLQLINKLIDLDIDNLHPISDKDKKLKFPFVVPIYTEIRINLLLDNLHNNFEDIRNLSSSILSKCPFILPVEETQYSMENSIDLCYSVKSRQSEGAAKYFEVLLKSFLNNDKPITPILNVFHDIFANFQINQQLPVNSRIHGVFTALKLILSNLPPSYFDDKSYWSEFFNKIIQVDQLMWTYIPQWLENDNSETGLCTNFSWRYIKESTEFMTCMYNIITQIDPKIVSMELPAYIQFLTQRIPEINHRGAVSSIYPALVTIIGYCYNSKHYQDFPNVLLSNCLSIITNKSKIITRRSGGLPNLITAILTSNKIAKGECKGMMETAMRALIPVTTLEVSNEEKNYDLPQVNTMNCIKGIFNDSNLTEESVTYLKEALLLCLANFKSLNWSIKNCALMLFTSLRNKLFPHTKRLSLSFFQEYDIKDLLLTFLKSNDCEIILAVLSIVSSLNFVNDEDTLNDFNTILVDLLSNESWKVRDYAACSIAEVLPESQYKETIVLLVNTEGSRNLKHGTFLAVNKIVEKHKNPNEFSQLILPLIDSLQWSTLKLYVDTIRLMDVPESYNIKLSVLFVNNMTTELDGIKQLSLNTLLKYLLEVHHSEDLIRLVIDTNPAFQEIVLDYLATKRDINISITWGLLEEHDKSLVYKTLSILELYPRVEDANLTPLLNLTKSLDIEISVKAISILLYYNYQCSEEFLLQLTIHLESELDSVRANCLSSIAHYLNRSEPNNRLKLNFLFIVFRFLTDENESIRHQAIEVLSSVMKLPHAYPSYKLISIFGAFIVSEFSEQDVSDITVASIMNYTPSIKDKVGHYIEDTNKPDERFVNDLDNPYRIDFVIIKKLVDILAKIDVSQEVPTLTTHINENTRYMAKFNLFNKPGSQWNGLLYSAIAHHMVLFHWGEGSLLSPGSTTPLQYREEFKLFPKGPLARLFN